MGRHPHIAFSFIGGEHQFLHGAPVVAALSRNAEVTVEAFVVDAADAAALRTLLERLGAGAVAITVMAMPAPIEALVRRRQDGFKVPRLLWWSRRMRAADLIVTLERTSTLLKRLPGHCPPMAHIPHGAGDRAKGYEGRCRYFDHLLVAGEKDRTRMIDYGLARPDQISATGYIKLAALRHLHAVQPRRLFDNDRPVVLYNPHFSAKLGSWRAFSESIIAQFAADRRFNLIVAPHVRLFEQASAEYRTRWANLSDPDWLLVDTGSQRCIDMTYTLAADIYLGDVSSQVYEFCAIPRPCVFIDAHGVNWQDNQHYAMWQLGDVIREKDELMPAIAAAWAQPNRKREMQVAAIHNSFGDLDADAAAVTADRLIELAQSFNASSR